MPRLSISLDIAANPLSFLYGTTAIYVASGLLPEFIADFSREFYKTNSGIKTFANAITHTRAANATMVDSDGVLKWGPHNLLLRSEELDNAVWSKFDATVTANATVAPDGTNTADQITYTATTDSRVIESINVSAGEYTFGIWVKGTAGETITLELDATVNQVTLSADWVLYTLTQTLVAGSRIIRLIRRAGDTALTVYAWGAHVYRSDLGGMVDNPERGDSYVPTTTSAVYMPRVGHHVYNGSAWVNEGLLHESEARTNLLTYSEVVDGAGWTDNGSTSTNLTDGALGVWDGVSIASQGQNFQRLNANNFVSVTSGDTLTIRAWVKEGTSGRLRINFRDVSSGLSSNIRGVFGSLVPSSNNIGDFSSVKKEDWGNGIVAVSGTITVNFTGDLEVGIGPDSAVSGETVIAYAAQLEVAPTPSSYIPTSGSTVTRAADVLTIPAANLPWPAPVVIGPELVTNGTFDTDSDWTKDPLSSGVLWVISGGNASIDGSQASISDIFQNITVTSGSVYAISFDVTVNSGSVQVMARNAPWSSIPSSTITTSGSYQIVRTASLTTVPVSFRAVGGANISIDNVSVREINPLAV
jgi:hypothetical protein